MKSPTTTHKMKVLDNIGLVLFLFSIVSVVLWSPRPFTISHRLGDVLDKVSQKEHFFAEKARNIPFKTDLATKDTIGRMKIDVKNGKDLYSNSLTQTNEDKVKPTLNEISNWIGVDQDPSITQEHLNNPDEKACEVKSTSKEIGKRNLDESYVTSNDLKDTTYNQNIELYKQTTTNYDQSNYGHEVFDKSNSVAESTTSTIEKVDHWFADTAHEVFDKSGSVVDVAENEVGKIMDTTFQEMDMKKTSKFPDNSVSNIVESSEENVCKEDPNESNTLHNNLQLLGTNDIEDDVTNTTNIVHTNVQLLGVDNSDDFITEIEQKNPHELNEQWDQMSKVRGLNLIEQSFSKVNHLWSTFVEDSKIDESKNELNSPKELHNFGNDRDITYDLNEEFDEDTKKYHREVSSQQYEHFQGDYDDDRNYEGVKGRIVKYSQRTYEDAKIGSDVDYKIGKYTQRVRNSAHHHYRDGRHKVSEVYKPMKNPIRNFRRNNLYNEHDRDDDDEDFYEEW